MLHNFMILAFFWMWVLLHNLLKETSLDSCSLFFHTGAEIKNGNGRVNFRDVPHCLEQVEEETSATK